MALKKLKEIREEKGFSAKEVAEILDIPKATYSNYEQGRREPKAEISKRIAKLFKCSIDELV